MHLLIKQIKIDSDGIHPFQIPVPKEKKRHLFRFGRKKSKSQLLSVMIIMLILLEH